MKNNKLVKDNLQKGVLCNIIKLEQRKENMIKYHKENFMLPLILAGFASALVPAAILSAISNNIVETKDPVDCVTNSVVQTFKQIDIDKHTETEEKKHKKSMDELTAILQRNLANIRIIAGLNSEIYANYLQVTRQAVSHIETGKVKLNVATGIAWSMMIKSIADEFVYNIPLKKTCNLLLYKLDDYSDEEINKFEEVISKIAKAKKAGVDDETLELLASFLPDIKDK